jgi:bifunctional non-homologous end joining protein LigD
VLGDQLKLPLPEEQAARHLPDRIVPMQAVGVDAPFDDPGYFFEPWWPGARALAFVESGRLRMQVSGLSDPLAAFSELRDLPRQVVGEGVVLDGTLLVLDDEGRPDAELLRRRLSGDGDDERHPGRPAYVASDLLWTEGVSWMRRPFAARRDRLTAVLPAGDRVIVGRGYVQEGTLVAEALAALGIDGLSARRLSSRYRGGPGHEAWLRAPITPPEPRPRPTLALILRLPIS